MLEKALEQNLLIWITKFCDYTLPEEGCLYWLTLQQCEFGVALKALSCTIRERVIELIYPGSLHFMLLRRSQAKVKQMNSPSFVIHEESKNPSWCEQLISKKNHKRVS